MAFTSDAAAEAAVSICAIAERIIDIELRPHDAPPVRIASRISHLASRISHLACLVSRVSCLAH
ncbi:hypothetical protein WS86_12190 [Burkholderia savannae]|uniref:hypothetical protein n=1 Tax=Burkholderia savannae TaxID=1637837 RepID=UPI00075F1860|nr:hypothetical protein [Burkholderia savannae]AOJ81291.1 hypothetical protein WS86_12190 [Burkholderia savannae]